MSALGLVTTVASIAATTPPVKKHVPLASNTMHHRHLTEILSSYLLACGLNSVAPIDKLSTEVAYLNSKTKNSLNTDALKITRCNLKLKHHIQDKWFNVVNVNRLLLRKQGFIIVRLVIVKKIIM